MYDIKDLEGIKHPAKTQVIQWCRCRGKDHRVALINDSIVLLDHHLDRELAMLDLGADPCGCMKIYLALQSRNTKHLSYLFSDKIAEMSNKVYSRELRKRTHCGRQLHLSQYANRQTTRVVELLMRHKCDYPTINHRTMIHVLSKSSRPFVCSVSCGDAFGGGSHIHLYVSVDKNWLEEVHKAGPSIVEGYLVLGIGWRRSEHSIKAIVASANNTEKDILSHQRFGVKNATAVFKEGEWRFEYMDPHDYFVDINHPAGLL